MAEPLYADIYRCKKDSGNFLPNSPYEKDLLRAVNMVNQNAKSTNLLFSYYQNVGELSATAFCAGYLKAEACSSCVNNTGQLLLKNCSKQKQALAWRSKCMVQYGLGSEIQKYDTWFVAHETSANKTKDISGLEKTLKTLVDKLIEEACKHGNTGNYAFGTLTYGSRQNVFMVVQCTSTLSGDVCNKCLLGIFGEMKPCCSGAIAAAIITTGCYMRYAHADFRIG